MHRIQIIPKTVPILHLPKIAAQNIRTILRTEKSPPLRLSPKTNEPRTIQTLPKIIPMRIPRINISND